MLNDDVKASITAQTKKKFNIAFIQLMSYEVRPEKFDQKVVVLAKNGQRVMIFSNKNPSKLETSLHYLEIKSIESKSAKELKLSHKENKCLRLISLTDGSEVDDIIQHIALQLKTVFPLLPLQSFVSKVDLSPPERATQLQAKLDSATLVDLAACSGISRMYICMCDLYGYSLVEEIIWDLDTIYLSQDSKTLYLRDFDHLSLRDHVPLVGALQYNEWFTGVDASNMKMTNDGVAEVLKVMKKNTSITTWNLSSTGLKSDFVQKLSSALSTNVSSKLVSLNLSGNTIEDKGVSYLSETFASLGHGMHSISLSQCSVSARGVNKLMEGIAQNQMMANTLHTFDISSNSLKGEELSQLYQFLAQPNVIQTLNMADTDSPLDSLIGAMSRGCVQHIEDLDVSGNSYSGKKSKEVKVTPAWKQFFTSVLILSKLNMSSCRLPASAMKEMLLGLTANVNQPSVTLDLSSNDLKSDGGMVLGSCVASLRHVDSIDLSDNGLDANLMEILPWFGKNGSIHHLYIGKNFSQLRNKALQQSLDALVNAIQDEHCALQSLSIADSKLRLDATVVINALGSSNSLKSLDISGNQIGDVGAKMLAKALTINSSLISVVWDRNGITVAGLNDIAQALQRNFTIQEMPLPIIDITACKGSQDAIQKASMEIQKCLQRNHAPRKMAYDQCYRLQQGFLVSSAQTIIEKRVREIHSLLNSLSQTDNLTPEQFTKANKLLSDADKSKQILVALQTVAIKCEEPPNRFTECLKEVVESLSSSVNFQLEKTRKEMMHVVDADCITVLTDKDTRRVLEDGAMARGLLEQSQISTLIDKHLVNDIQSLISSSNFNVAFYIAETVIDKIVDLLNNKYEELKSLKRASGIADDDVSIAPSEMADTVGSSGMTYLGEGNLPDSLAVEDVTNRQSVMNTLRRRPQSILVRDPADLSNDFTKDVITDHEPGIPEVDAGTAMAAVPEHPMDTVWSGDGDKSVSSGGEVEDAEVKVVAPPMRSKSLSGLLETPARDVSLMDEVMGALNAKNGSSSEDSSETGAMKGEESVSKGDAVKALPQLPPPEKRKYSRSSSETSVIPPTAGAKAKLTPPLLPAKAKSMKLPTKSAAETDEVFVSKPKTPASSLVTSAAGEPEVSQLPDVAVPSLTHLNKERPKRAKKQVSRRPVPSPAVTTDDDVVPSEGVEDFFKPVTVSQTPVMAPTSKSRSGSKGDSVSSSKPEESPRAKPVKPRSPFGGSHKDKQEAEKKKGGLLASGISNFFKGKKKPEKTLDSTDSKAEPVAPPRAEKPGNQSRNASVDIPAMPAKPEKAETPDVAEPAVATEMSKTSSLERSVTADTMTSSAMSSISENEVAEVPIPKKRPMGVGLPGMSSGLLAEMQSKRMSKQPVVPPKASPRPVSAKTDGNISPQSPPARPQPPALKPSASAREAKKEPPAAEKEETSPKAAPQKPKAAPRDSTTAPAKPPALRPKPAPKPGKPSKPPPRPVTVSDASRVSLKTAPPKPPPPNLSKRQTYVEPKSVSPPFSSPAPPQTIVSASEAVCEVQDAESAVISSPVAAVTPTAPDLVEEDALASTEPLAPEPTDNAEESAGEDDSTEDEGLRGSASQGNLLIDPELSSRGSTASSARDSLAEELAVQLRNGKRNSGSRLSNGSLPENRLSSPSMPSAHLEDGPVLKPPRMEQATNADAVGNSDDESLV